MGFKQLSELPEKQNIAGSEKVYINDNGVSKQVDIDKVKSDQLPEVTSEDDGKVLKVVDGEWGKGEAISRAGDVYIIHFLSNAENPLELSCDTTFAEVLNAWQSGKSIFAIVKGISAIFAYLSGIGGSGEYVTSFHFSYFSVAELTSGSVLADNTISLSSNDNISASVKIYTLTEA